MSQQEVEITTKNYIVPPKAQSAFPIQVTEWKKIKRNIQKVIPHRRIFENLAYVLFGVSASSTLSLITFFTIEQILKNWVIPTFVAITIGSLLVAICLLVLDSQQKQMITLSATKIVEEMEELELNYCLPFEEIKENSGNDSST